MIPYLEPGASPTAEVLNTLFEEADRKLALALDNKPIFFWPLTSVTDPAGVLAAGYEGASKFGWSDIVGKKFFFLAGSSEPFFCEKTFGFEYSGGNVQRDDDYAKALSVGGYNHEVFQQAEASAVPLSSLAGSIPAAPIHCDFERKILFIKPIANTYWEMLGRSATDVQFGFFAHSLQAHRKNFLPAGTGGAAHAVITDGKITSIVVDTAGTYNVPPLVRITGDGTGATAEARLYSGSLFTGDNSDKLHSIRVLNQGENYTSATVEIVPVSATLEPYWIMEGKSDSLIGRSLEYIRKYDQAELIFEGVPGIDIPATWDKYNFFRLHNFNRFEIVVSFPGFSVTVPPLQSKCVRRDSATSGYLEGWKYFHRFKAGDVETFAMSGYAAGNNVFNRSMLLKIARRLRYGTASGDGRPLALTDESLLWDASSVYCGTGKPFPEVTDGTMIGDLLHHRGNVHLMAANGALVGTFSFAGWVNFKNELSTLGATVSEDATTGEITIQHAGSITATGCNLILATSERVSNGLTGAGWTIPQFTIKARPLISADAKTVAPIFKHTEQLSLSNYSYALNDNGHPIAGNPSPVSYNRPYGHYLYFGLPIGTATPRLGQARVIYQEQNIGWIKRLNWNGEPNFAGTDQANEYTSWTSSFSFTGFGPMLVWNKIIKPEALEWTPGIINRFADGVCRSLDGSGNLIEKDFINFHQGGFTDYNAVTITGHCSPRAPRVYINRSTQGLFNIYAALDERVTMADGYPQRLGVYSGEKGFINIWERVTVEDKTPWTFRGSQSKHNSIKILRKFSEKKNKTALLGEWQAGRLAYLTVLAEAPINYNFNDQNHDELMPLLIDHYNNLASVINAITRIEPLSFTSLFPIGASNSLGIFGSTIRPKNHYRTLESTAEREDWQLLGVPIRSQLDLPDSYRELINAQDSQFRVKEEDNSIERFDPGRALLTAYWKQRLFGNSGAVQNDYEWVSVEDVKTAAEDLGFKFFFSRFATPRKLEIFDAGTPAIIETKLEDGDRNYYPRKEGDSCPARFPVFAVDSAGDWISTPSTYRIWDAPPADIFTYRFANIRRFVVTGGPNAGEVLFIENGYQLASIPVDDAFLKTQTPQGIPGAIMFQTWSSETEINHKLIEVPSYAVNFGTGFSSVSPDNARARNYLGFDIVPGSFVAPSGATEVSDASTESTISGGPSLVYALTDWTQEANP